MNLSKMFWRTLGALAISTMALWVYQPTLRGGFWTDDYQFLGAVVRLTSWDYWALYFDPLLRQNWYRPMHGIQWWIGYNLFGVDATGYHLIQNLLHTANCLLLYGLVTHFSKSWRAGLIAGLMYAVIPLASLAVFWLGVADPILTTWALLAMVLWTRYLERGNHVLGLAAVIACVGAMLSKEPGIILPLVLFLIDLWLVAKPMPLGARIRRYGIFIVVWAIYIPLVYIVLHQSVFPRSWGYSIGANLVSNLINYTSRLAFPWETDLLIRYIFLATAVGAMAIALIKRSYRVLFLGVAAVLGLGAVLPFAGFFERYAYVSTLATAAGIGLLFGTLYERLDWRWTRVGLVAGITLVILVSGIQTNAKAESFTEASRLVRLQFRPIFQNHPTFPSDTYLYFINPPLPMYNISGLLYSRYATDLTVVGDDSDIPPQFRDHASSWIFYFDDTGNVHEYSVNRNASIQTTPMLPAQFGEFISLEAIQVADTQLKPNDALVLFFYWRGLKKMTQDYTVFTHLIDETGNTITGYDSPPERGTNPTSNWEPGALSIDALVVPIETGAPLEKNLRVEIGLYSSATGERLPIVNASGDSITLKGFNVAP